jgi:hypothetical protein
MPGTSDSRDSSINVKRIISLSVTIAVAIAIIAIFADRVQAQKDKKLAEQINANAQQMVDQGRQIFRFDTFGDEAFWATRSSFIRQFKARCLMA